MVPYTQISDTDGGFALAFADVGLGWAKYLVSAGEILLIFSSCRGDVRYVFCAFGWFLLLAEDYFGTILGVQVFVPGPVFQTLWLPPYSLATCCDKGCAQFDI